MACCVNFKEKHLHEYELQFSDYIQCSRKLPTLYRTCGQTEYESLSDRQNFSLTEKQSARFGKIIKGGVCVCVCGGGGGGREGFFL